MEAGREALQRNSSVLVTAPTGAGKTVMMAEMIRQAARKGFHSDIVVHREELISQSQETVQNQTGMAAGIIWKKFREWDRPIRILSHGTVAGMESLPPQAGRPHLLFLDEAHHGAAPGWRHAVNIIAPRWLVGFTATPFRNDKTPLVPEPFAEVVRTITPQELIDLGVLVPPVVVSPAVSDRHGQPQPVSQAANLPRLYRDAVRYAIGRGRNKIILFTSSNGRHTPSQVGEQTRQELQRAGIPCGFIGEDCDSAERKRFTASFEKMPTAVLINYMTLTEGFDSKCVDCVILGRQSQSESTLIQMIGRGLREYPGKTSCLVLNFTGRADINNIVNYWRLDGAPKRKNQREAAKSLPSEKQLDRLTMQFPGMISAIGDTRIEYPWLQPFPRRRLRTLCMWNPDQPERGDTYICVEPTKNSQWQVSRVRIPDRRSGPVKCISRSGLSSQDAAKAVDTLVGGQGRLFNRRARWRNQPATDRQRRTWKSIHETEPPDHLTRGDASDAISLATFRERVSPKMI